MNKSLLFTFVVVLFVILVVIYIQQEQINKLKSSLAYANTEVISQNSTQLEEEKIEREPMGFKIPNKKSEDED